MYIKFEEWYIPTKKRSTFDLQLSCKLADNRFVRLPHFICLFVKAFDGIIWFIVKKYLSNLSFNRYKNIFLNAYITANEKVVESTCLCFSIRPREASMFVWMNVRMYVCNFPPFYKDRSLNRPTDRPTDRKSESLGSYTSNRYGNNICSIGIIYFYSMKKTLL